MPNEFASTTELQGWLGLSRTRISKLAKAGVIPKAGRGKWDVKLCVIGYLSYLKAVVQASGNGMANPDQETGDDPDGMGLDERLKYWQGVRAKQQCREEVLKILDSVDAKYRAMAAETMGRLRAALGECNLTDAQLMLVNAALDEVAAEVKQKTR